MSTELRTLMDALRPLAKLNVLNQVSLDEQIIDEYVKANGGHLTHTLERLRNVIHEEEVANRAGENWSIARDYVRRMLHTYSLMFQPERSDERFDASEVWAPSVLKSIQKRAE